MLQEVCQHLVRVGVIKIGLRDGHDDRYAGRLGVIYRLDGLRHDRVIGSNHEHGDIRGVGAAGAHGREGRVTGRVEEGNPLTGFQLHLIGADMLRDAAGLAGDDIGLAQGIE